MKQVVSSFLVSLAWSAGIACAIPPPAGLKEARPVARGGALDRSAIGLTHQCGELRQIHGKPVAISGEKEFVRI
jgi:hypothetical protein